MKRLLLPLLLLLASAARAQVPVTITTLPSPPVAGAPFIIRVTRVACPYLTRVEVNGSNIDVFYAIPPVCIATPPIVNQDITAPPLPPGNYTIRLLLENTTTPGLTQAIAVAADIPALDRRLLALLAAALAVVALRFAAR